MSIHVRACDNVRVVELHGDIAIGRQLSRPLDLQGHPMDDLRETIRGLLEQGHCRIVMDLRELRFIDSAGLGELVACRKRTLERGGDIVLVHPRKKVQELLVMTLLSEVFRTFEDETEAVASFAPR
ncbi:MAG: STAS domain-containing protein [Candidatus Polarisedimenticolia bacterium]